MRNGVINEPPPTPVKPTALALLWLALLIVAYRLW
jgi:hypothetical protein